MLSWIRSEQSVISGSLRGLRIQDQELIWHNSSFHDQECPVNGQLSKSSVKCDKRNISRKFHHREFFGGYWDPLSNTSLWRSRNCSPTMDGVMSLCLSRKLLLLQGLAKLWEWSIDKGTWVMTLEKAAVDLYGMNLWSHARKTTYKAFEIKGNE